MGKGRSNSPAQGSITNLVFETLSLARKGSQEDGCGATASRLEGPAVAPAACWAAAAATAAFAASET